MTASDPESDRVLFRRLRTSSSAEKMRLRMSARPVWSAGGVPALVGVEAEPAVGGVG